MRAKSIDIFCQVIDNFGDVGVCYRLYKELQTLFGRELKIRLILDKEEEFWMLRDEGREISILDYEAVKQGKYGNVSDVVIEAFGCDIPENYLEEAYQHSKLLINLEYFSAEAWTEEFHLQESILGKGSCRKFFFMPGLSEKTGGILSQKSSLRLHFQDFGLERENYDWIGSIFSYEKDFSSLLECLQRTGKRICLCILGQKSQESIKKILGNLQEYDRIHLEFLPFYSQEKYELLLDLCDFNFVRGEDSFARALLSGKAFLWQIYPQEAEVHIQKLRSFLELYCPKNLALQEVFLRYNQGQENYDYFFAHLEELTEYNQNYAKYLQEHCNLGKKLKEFIEKF